MTDEPPSRSSAETGRLGAESLQAQEPSNSPEPIRNASGPASRSTARSPAPSGVEAAFHTGDPGLAGARVAFAFIRADAGLLEGEQEVRLEAVPGAPGVWEGVWQGGVGFSAPGELVFRVCGEE